MVRGRTTAPAGMVLGHEITGEVIEKGHDVEYLETGDLVSVPFKRLSIFEQAPEGYKSFDAGVANKFVIDPHGHLSEAA
jgi:NADPH:quinone reductase-like Zn-dependent oxidoreductase